jgi:hypothetical protein
MNLPVHDKMYEELQFEMKLSASILSDWIFMCYSWIYPWRHDHHVRSHQSSNWARSRENNTWEQVHEHGNRSWYMTWKNNNTWITVVSVLKSILSRLQKEFIAFVNHRYRFSPERISWMCHATSNLCVRVLYRIFPIEFGNSVAWTSVFAFLHTIHDWHK